METLTTALRECEIPKGREGAKKGGKGERNKTE